MCGGTLDYQEGMTVCECEYCGSKQTVPTVDNEKKMRLFDRANRLRYNCEFDKAGSVYESIIEEFPDEAEGYWGNLLCKYGIEYVDDPIDGRKVPTCHRASFDSIMDNEDFELVMENADVVARGVYREQAKQIEKLRKGIVEVSANELPYDIFICYKETDEKGDRTIDSVIAQDTYDALTAKGYRVFFSRISLEDKLGTEYEPYIFSALNSAKIMLVFGSNYDYYNAVWVKNEWGRFLKLMENDKTKYLIPCFKDIDAYDMPKEFRRLQAQDMGKVGAIQDLVRGIEKLIPRSDDSIDQVGLSAGIGIFTVHSLLKRAFMFLEEGNWENADDYAEKVLDIDPECGEAYLAKGMSQLKIMHRADLSKLSQFMTNKYIQKANRFGDDSLRSELGAYNLEIERREEEERRKKKEERRIEEEELRIYEEELLKKKEELEKKRQEKEKEQLKKEEKRKAEKETVQQEFVDTVYHILFNRIDQDIAQVNSLLYELEKEASAYDGVEEMQKSLETERENIKRKIEVLEAKKSELGLFAMKQKRQIADEIESFNSRIHDISERVNEYRKKSVSRREIEKKIANCNAKRDLLEREKQESRYNKNDEYENALRVYLQDNKVRTQMAVSSIKTVAKMKIYDKRIVIDISLGRYRKGNQSSIESDEIIWQVLDIDGDKLLIISKYGLVCQRFNKTFGEVTWEQSTLREWLNGCFYNEVFSVQEKNVVEERTITADVNPKYDSDPGNNTRDKVFLLSIDDAKEYFSSDFDRECEVTDYLKNHGAENHPVKCEWWLRTPGNENERIAFVNTAGMIMQYGNQADNDSIYVRPAAWIDSSWVHQKAIFS